MCKECIIKRRHIRRLQIQNQLLSEVITDERRWRQKAWETAWKWIHDTALNRLFCFIRFTQGFEKQRARFEKASLPDFGRGDQLAAR